MSDHLKGLFISWIIVSRIISLHRDGRAVERIHTALPSKPLIELLYYYYYHYPSSSCQAQMSPLPLCFHVVPKDVLQLGFYIQEIHMI